MISFRPHVPVTRKQTLPTNLRYLASLRQAEQPNQNRIYQQHQTQPHQIQQGSLAPPQSQLQQQGSVITPQNQAQTRKFCRSCTSKGCHRRPRFPTQQQQQQQQQGEWNSECARPVKNHIQANIVTCSQAKQKSPRLPISNSFNYGQRANQQRSRINSSTSTSSTNSDSSVSNHNKQTNTNNTQRLRPGQARHLKPVQKTPATEAAAAAVATSAVIAPSVAVNKGIVLDSTRKQRNSHTTMMPSVTSRLKKNISRTKEKILQGIGKTDKTEDEIFDLYVENFDRQHSQANKLSKELNRYLTQLKVR